MKNQLLFFGRYALLWLAFFVVTKALFLIFHHEQTSALSLTEILNVFWYGLRMDLSATGYMLLLPGLIMVASPFIAKRSFLRTNQIVFIILGLFLSFITVLDFELYRHWGFRLDLTPLNYAGKDAASSTSWVTAVPLIVYWLAIFAAFYWSYKKFVSSKLDNVEGKWWHAPIYLVITAALTLPIRGSLDVGPMNLGFVYFHKDKPFANHSAINVFWNLGNAIYKANDAERYPENFVRSSKAEQDFKSLYTRTGSLDTVKVLSTNRPNILLIILEGITSKIIAPLGGDSSIMPNFNKLCQEGILFSNYYASGDRTDKGIISILSAYPAQPKTSIIKYASKSEKLPKLTLDLEKAGYHSSFVYGGDVNFASMNSYLNMSGFDEILNNSHFDEEYSSGKWGVHDHIVMDTLIDHLSRQEQPFFSTMLTLSSHEPFDVPMEPVFEGRNDETLFLNSAHYTDQAFGDFIKQARNSSWWDSTLIVVLADHGNRHPNKSPNYVPERFQIPMLWLGGAISQRDTVISTFGSQTDLAPTLLQQLDLPNDQYSYGRNILSTQGDDFAYYIFNNGFGYVDDSTKAIYDLGANRTVQLSGDPKGIDLGKSYMQRIYSDFNEK